MKKTLSVSIPIAWTRNRLTTISVDCETTLSPILLFGFNSVYRLIENSHQI
jgi:hypothetical protein